MRDSETSEPIETFTINDIDAEYIIRNPKYTRRKRQRLQEEEREFRKTYKAVTNFFVKNYMKLLFRLTQFIVVCFLYLTTLCLLEV